MARLSLRLREVAETMLTSAVFMVVLAVWLTMHKVPVQGDE